MFQKSKDSARNIAVVSYEVVFKICTRSTMSPVIVARQRSEKHNEGHDIEQTLRCVVRIQKPKAEFHSFCVIDAWVQLQ